MARDIEGESDYYRSHGGIIPVKWTAPEVRQFPPLVRCWCGPSGRHFSVIVSHLMLMRPGAQNGHDVSCTLGDSVYNMLPFWGRCDCMCKLATINPGVAQGFMAVKRPSLGVLPRTRIVINHWPPVL